MLFLWISLAAFGSLLFRLMVDVKARKKITWKDMKLVAHLGLCFVLFIGMIIPAYLLPAKANATAKKPKTEETSKIAKNEKEVWEKEKTIDQTQTLSAEDKKRLGFSPTITDEELKASLSADPSKNYIIVDVPVYSLRNKNEIATKREKELQKNSLNPNDAEGYEVFIYGQGKLNKNTVYYFREAEDAKGSLGNIKAYPEDIVSIHHIDNSYDSTITKTYRVVQTANSIIKQLIKVTVNIPENAVMEEY